jgi:universal stress protein E
MNPICNILVIVDPTASEHPAVDKAARLASRFDARLELFSCETKVSRESRRAAHLRTQPQAPFEINLKPKLEALAKPLREQGIDVTTEVGSGDPLHVALLDRVQRTSAELVVKDTHHHTIAQRTFLTNTDWQLIRGCAVPLLLTKSRPWARSPSICAAVDPGHVNDKPEILDHRILDQAAVLARRLTGKLHVMHAYLPLELVGTAMTTPPMLGTVTAEDLDRARTWARVEVERLVAKYDVDPANIHLELGSASEMVPRAAADLAVDIMVMGAISRTGLQRVFIGSTAEDVLERLPCDALVVKTPGFAAALAF